MATRNSHLFFLLALLLVVLGLVSADPGHEDDHHDDGDNDGTPMCACQPSTWTLALNLTRPADCQHTNLPSDGHVLVGIASMSCDYQAFSDDGTDDPADHIMEEVDFVQIHEYNRKGKLLNDDKKPEKVFVGPYHKQEVGPLLSYTSVVVRMSEQHDVWMKTQQEQTDSDKEKDQEDDEEDDEDDESDTEDDVKSSNGLRNKRKQPKQKLGGPSCPCHGAHKPGQAMPMTCLPTKWKVDIYGKNSKKEPLLMEWTIFFTNDCNHYPLGLEVTEPAATHYYLGPLTLVRIIPHTHWSNRTNPSTSLSLNHCVLIVCLLVLE